MKLRLPDGSQVSNPSPEQIAQAILQRKGDEKIELAAEDGRMIRYSEESMFSPSFELFDGPGQPPGKHPAASGLSVQQAILAFQRFAARDPQWSRDVKFNINVSNHGSGCITTSSKLLILLILIYTLLRITA